MTDNVKVDSTVSTVPVLTGAENYFQWEQEMLTVLMTIGADGIVDGSEPMPVVVEIKPTDGKEAISWYQWQMRRLDDWEKRNRAAKGYMLRTIAKSIKTDVTKCRTAREIWEKLKELHQTERPELRTQALRELLAMKYRQGDDPNAYTEKFTELVEKANSAGEDIKDERRCEIFLDTLSTDFDSVHTRFYTAAKSERNFTQLKTLFFNQVNRIDRTRNDGADELMYTSNKKYGNQRNGNGRSGHYNGSRDEPRANNRSDTDGDRGNRGSSGNCYYCNKPGHGKAECPMRKRHLEERGEDKGEDMKAYLGAAYEAYLGAGFTGAVISKDQDIRSALHVQSSDGVTFILDSGATEHICGDRTVMTNIRKLSEPREFKTVSGFIKAHEVGEVKVKGNAAGDVTFKDVMYLPGAANLLSYGVLLNRQWRVQPTETGGHISVGGDTGPGYELKKLGRTGTLRVVSFTLTRGSNEPTGFIGTAQTMYGSAKGAKHGNDKRLTARQQEPATVTLHLPVYGIESLEPLGYGEGGYESDMEADEVERENLPNGEIHGAEVIGGDGEGDMPEPDDDTDLSSLKSEPVGVTSRITRERGSTVSGYASDGSGTSTHGSGHRRDGSSSGATTSNEHDDGTQSDGEVFTRYGRRSVKRIRVDYDIRRTRTRTRAARLGK
jgi:hypothetical protein